MAYRSLLAQPILQVLLQGWGVMGSHKVVGKSSVKIETAKWHQLVPFSTLHIMANLTSQPCGDLQPAVCLSRGDGAI